MASDSSMEVKGGGHSAKDVACDTTIRFVENWSLPNWVVTERMVKPFIYTTTGGSPGYTGQGSSK